MGLCIRVLPHTSSVTVYPGRNVLRSFSSHGSCPGEFNKPQGLPLMNSTLSVCNSDTHNNPVQCYEILFDFCVCSMCDRTCIYNILGQYNHMATLRER